MHRRIGLFFKSSTPGAVKTRLCPPLSPDQAALLNEAFLDDAVALCRGVSGSELFLFQAGDPAGPFPGSIAGLPLLPQRGRDLGERMGAALSDLLSTGDTAAVIVGSDIPNLPTERLEEAFRALATEDVVLGPSTDGGYYLIGLKRPDPTLFTGVAWGGPEVLEKTLENARRAGLRPFLLDPWHDVDTADDLGHLAAELEQNGGIGAPATRRILAWLGLLGG